MIRTPLPRRRSPIFSIGILSVACCLTGCASDRTAYPSLAPRAVEKQGFAEPEAPVAVASPDTALDGKLAALDRQLRSLDSRFDNEAAAAGRAARAAKGARAGSEPWISAQTLLAGLDDLRAQTSSLLTDIEDLAITRASMLAPDYPALTALGQRARTLIGQQNDRIDRLQASLAPA